MARFNICIEVLGRVFRIRNIQADDIEEAREKVMSHVIRNIRFIEYIEPTNDTANDDGIEFLKNIFGMK